jgi:hypothetical protein
MSKTRTNSSVFLRSDWYTAIQLVNGYTVRRRGGFAQKSVPSLRSRRKHKAWGASPRTANQQNNKAREAGDSVQDF